MSLDCGGLWATSTSQRSLRDLKGRQQEPGLTKRLSSPVKQTGRRLISTSPLLVGLSLVNAPRHRTRWKSQRSDTAVEVKPDIERAPADAAAPEAWLFEMSRGEYLRKRIRPDLAESVSDLCDLELFVLGLHKEQEQSEVAAKLRSLSTASGSRILGVTRSKYVEKRINKELCTKHISQVSVLNDIELAQLGNAGSAYAEQERKLEELLAKGQDGLLGNETTRKDCVEAQLTPAARTHGVHKLSDVAVYILAQKRPKDEKKFLVKLQDLEDTLSIQRFGVIRKLDETLKDHLCALDDVTLAQLAKKSPEEQRRWQVPQEPQAAQAQSVSEPEAVGVPLGVESSESQKDESRPSGKHEVAVAQIVREAKEAKNSKAAKNSKNGKPILTPPKGGAKEPESESTRPLGKHEGAVAQIVAREAKEAKDGKAVKSSKNGQPMLTPSKAEAEEPDKSLSTPKSGQAIESATATNLQSLVNRGCRLIAVSVCGELFRDSPISGIMLRENDTARPALWISQAALKKTYVQKMLKHIFEADEVLKVVHDCPMVSDVLNHQLGLMLNNVFDTAIAWQLLDDSERPRKPSVSQVLNKYGKMKGSLHSKTKSEAQKEKNPKPAQRAEMALFDLMGMACGPAPSEHREDKEVILFELQGLLVASIAMSKLLKDQSKTFKQLCQEGLRKFRQWPGQHVDSLSLGQQVFFSFVDHKLVCHLRPNSKDLKAVVETVNDEQLAEDASAAGELKRLLSLLPKTVLEAVETHWAEIGVQPMELVLSVRRQVEFRCRPLGEKRMRCDFLRHVCSSDEINAVVQKIGAKNFTVQDRAGIDGTLHRISAVRNTSGDIVTLVMRIGRSSRILAGLLEDILADSKSILILGPPGVGKTTLLRACAARLSEDQSTVIVDPAGEIAGCGDEPHKSVGRSLKDMAYSRSPRSRSEARREAMTRVVENMTPKVLVVDEIGTKSEASAARTIGERGVQLVATAHGHNIFDLLANTELRDLVGGLISSTLGDDNPRYKEFGRKNIQERSARPVFSTLVELRTPFSVAVHMDVAGSVDAALLGAPMPVQVRSRDPTGQMHVELARI